MRGCGETVVDDVKARGTRSEANLETSLGEKVEVRRLPLRIEVEPGKTFNCTIILAEGKKETATLRIRNEDADLSRRIVGLSAGG